ncbi:kinase-like protein [Dentipellis sp. KUC8613]|nr:kinase-like protein [Dentipellis sp. KUC8613]
MSPAAMFLSAFSPAASLAPLPDDEGEQVAGYTLGPTIGYGGFSTIRKGTSPSGGTVAIKVVRRADVDKAANPSLARERLDNETAIWETLSHEHILPLFRSVHTPYADFFIMPYCPAGTLYDILKRDGRPALPHDDAGMMFRQVVRGLRYMHEEMGLVHGDIKLENVLVDEMGVCKIGDFGMTRRIGVLDEAEDSQQQQEPQHSQQVQQPPPRRQRSVTNEHMSSIPHRLQMQAKRQGKTGLPIHLSLLRHHSGPRHRNSSPLPSAQNVATSHAIYEFQPGSLPYASPELLRPPSASHPYQPNPAQDIWALGVMLYALLTGRLPFMDSFEPRLQMKILHGVYDMPPGIGRGAELVLQGCLEHAVAQRWTIVAVDELGWSIGWGHEGEEPCPADKEIDRMVLEAQQSRSHSNSRSVIASVSRSRSRAPCEIQDDEYAEEASAHLRSCSRSRSSHPPSRSRSADRLRAPLPFSNPASVSPASSAPSLARSAESRGRGRNVGKTPSRSPSPSVPPMTPTDARFLPPAPPIARDPSRGRKGFRCHPGTAASPSSELDVLHESLHWTLSPQSTSHSRSPARFELLMQQKIDEERERGMSESPRARRSGSTPPWNVARSSPSVGVSNALAHASPSFVLTAGSTPIPVPAGTRSRSAGVEMRGRRRSHI